MPINVWAVSVSLRLCRLCLEKHRNLRVLNLWAGQKCRSALCLPEVEWPGNGAQSSDCPHSQAGSLSQGLRQTKYRTPHLCLSLSLLFCVCAQVCGCAYVCKRQRYRETDRQTQTDRVHSHTPWWQLTVASGAISAGAGDHHDISWLTFEVWLWSVLSGEALNVYWSVSPQSSWRQARDLLGP